MLRLVVGPAIACQLKSRLVVLAVSATALLLSAAPARAAVFPCTEAGILDAIATGGGPHTFACGGPATVTTSAEIAINNDVILDGEDDLTVDGNDTHRVFLVEAGVTAELRSVTVTGGFSTGNSGGIANQGTLTITSSTVSQNRAGEAGGGIGNFGTLTVTNSTISNNTAVLFGGGIGAAPDSLTTVTESTVSGNIVEGGDTDGSGGGIGVAGATLTVTNSTVSGNTTARFAGGIGNFSSTATVENSTISNNTAGIDGGGFHSNPGPLGLVTRLTITNSTVSGNSASTGGGIRNAGSLGLLTLTNSTVSGNTAAAFGGGLTNDFDATGELINSTISGNIASIGGGIYSPNGTLTVANSTVAENIATSTGGGIVTNATKLTNTLIDDDCFTLSPTGLTSMGGNVESPGDTCALTDSTDQVNVTASQLALGPLQDNGGPTQTRALGTGSVAIDAAVDCPPPDADQRGLTRPQGLGCDVGAVEMADADGDDVVDPNDNCLEVANADQRDADIDGYGTVCDPDYNNDGAVGIPDFNVFRPQFGLTDEDPGFDPAVDHIGDGAIGIPDFNVFRSYFGEAPGPSGLSCAGTVPCPAP